MDDQQLTIPAVLDPVSLQNFRNLLARYGTSIGVTDNSSLSLGTVYTNTSGRNQLHLINTLMTSTPGATGQLDFLVNGSVVMRAQLEETAVLTLFVSGVVPSDATYELRFTDVGGGGAGVGFHFWQAITF